MIAVLVGCSVKSVSNDDPAVRILINDSRTTIRDGQTVAPGSVVCLAWEKVAGRVVLCNFTLYLDNQPIQRKNSVEEVVFSVEEEGRYVAELVVSGSRAEPVRFSFFVTRLYEELYQSPGGRIYTEVDPSFLGLETCFIRFYRYSCEALPGTNEVIHRRDAMNLKDTNLDGVYDFWEIIPNAYAETVSLPCALSRYYTSWHICGMQYEERAVAILYYGISGEYTDYYLTVPLASVGFALGVPFARHIADTAQTVNHYASYTLRERYETNEQPEFHLELRTANPSHATDFVIAVSAEHVSDFAKVYETRYIQLGVAFDDRLVLKNVQFQNFMEGKREISAYRLNADGNGALLYRGFIEGEDEKTAVSPDFALLTFGVKSGEKPNTVDLSLIYANNLLDCDNFPDTPNPVFKNRENHHVDGFFVQHNPIRIAFLNTGADRE